MVAVVRIADAQCREQIYTIGTKHSDRRAGTTSWYQGEKRALGGCEQSQKTIPFWRLTSLSQVSVSLMPLQSTRLDQGRIRPGTNP